MSVPSWGDDNMGAGGRDKDLLEGKLSPLGFHFQAVY